MRRAPRAEQPLRLLFDNPRSTYICRACRQLAPTAPIRQFHASASASASSRPWYQSIRDTIFGEKNKPAKTATPNEDQESQLEDDLMYDDAEVMNGSDRKKYTVARRFDPAQTSDYVAARTWAGMERIGSEEWVRRTTDKGQRYNG